MHNTVAQQLYEYVRNHPFRLPYTDAATLLEWLYICYAETQEQDSPEINQSFINLGTHLELLPLDENNAIFAIVCELCNAYEKRAFMDAIKLGAYLMTELLGK